MPDKQPHWEKKHKKHKISTHTFDEENEKNIKSAQDLQHSRETQTKTLMRHHNIYSLKWLNLKGQKYQLFSRIWGNWDSYTMLVQDSKCYRSFDK